MFTWVVIGALVVLLIVVGIRFERKGRQDAISKALAAHRNFVPSQVIVAADALTGMAIDESRRKICLAETVGDRVLSWVYDYSAILDVQLSEDGVAITQRQGTIGRAAVGGLLFGEAGAIVGGLSGTTATSTQVQRIELRLVINDTSRPSHVMCLMVGPGSGTSKNSALYQDSARLAHHWHALLRVLASGSANSPQISSARPVAPLAIDQVQTVCCPHCDAEYRLKVPVGGKKYRCANCREVFAVSPEGVKAA